MSEEEMEEEAEVAEEEVADGGELEEVTEASTRSSRSRTANYNQVEDVALCYAWMNISMDVMIGTIKPRLCFGREL